MPRALHIVVTIKAGTTVMIVVLTGAVHLVNGSPSGLLAPCLTGKVYRLRSLFSSTIADIRMPAKSKVTLKTVPDWTRQGFQQLLRRAISTPAQPSKKPAPKST
jgi:hypothetical protein